MRQQLGFVEVTTQNPVECFLELLVRQGVAKRINGTVSIAEKVGEVKEVVVHTARRVRTEALDQSADMVRRPANHERPENERYGA